MLSVKNEIYIAQKVVDNLQPGSKKIRKAKRMLNTTRNGRDLQSVVRTMIAEVVTYSYKVNHNNNRSKT